MIRLLFVLLTCTLLFSNSISYAKGASATINVSATILPLFELNVTSNTGGNLEFGAISKDADKAVTANGNEIQIQARSNTGQAYSITQELHHYLQNASGVSMPADSMTVTAKNLKTDGKAATNLTVSTEPSVLFQSNTSGKSDTILANYKLKVDPKQDAGTYQSKLTYTIVTV